MNHKKWYDSVAKSMVSKFENTKILNLLYNFHQHLNTVNE